MKYIQYILISHETAELIKNILVMVAIFCGICVFVDGFRGKSSDRIFRWIFSFFGLLMVMAVVEGLDETKKGEWMWSIGGVCIAAILFYKVYGNYRLMLKRRANGELIGQEDDKPKNTGTAT